jgi:hypothetical protein
MDMAKDVFATPALNTNILYFNAFIPLVGLDGHCMEDILLGRLVTQMRSIF